MGGERAGVASMTGSISFIINSRGRARRRSTAYYCLLSTVYCLLLTGCGNASADRDIGPDTARRELFLRGYSYREDVFLNAAKEGETVGVKLFLIAGMSP